MKTQPLRRTLGTASVILLALVLLVPLAGAQPPAEGGGTPDPLPNATNSPYRVSDSPWMQLPEELKDWPPILPPEPRDLEGVEVEDPGAVVTYDRATGRTVLVPSGDQTQQPAEAGLRSTSPYSGLLPPGIGIDTVFPPDDRQRVPDTYNYPWSSVAKLFISFPDGAYGWCSGVLIGCPDNYGYKVLTAGHCVYSHDNGGWARWVLVYPGLDNNYTPYYHAWDTNLTTWNGWINNRMTEYDMGIVTLDRNVGNFAGWMGRITAPYSDPIYTGGAYTAGYPCNTSSSSCPYPVTPVDSMWYDYDSGRTASEYNHWYWMDTQPGQSGSPVWLYDGSSHYIMTIHTTSGSSSDGNHGTRLNQSKFDTIISLCNSDSPPTDYADLIDDGPSWSGFSPTAVTPGSTSFQAWSDVRNAGTAYSGGFYVQYRASTNTTCSTGDFLIGTAYVNSIAPFNWADANWSGTFPSGLADGTYYVCWIIDSGNNVPEFVEGNNTEYISSPRLVVGTGLFHVYLPLVIRQSSQDPYEPNDTFEQAWGPLASGETYHAFFPTEADNNDFYYFNLGATHSVEIWLTDIPSGNNYNLYLYDEAHVLIGYSGEPGQANEHIYNGSLSSGKYYVRINRGAGTSSTQPYALRVVY